jgi:hypothetical protein
LLAYSAGVLLILIIGLLAKIPFGAQSRTTRYHGDVQIRKD